MSHSQFASGFFVNSKNERGGFQRREKEERREKASNLTSINFRNLAFYFDAFITLRNYFSLRLRGKPAVLLVKKW